jgi:hypothetical protein
MDSQLRASRSPVLVVAAVLGLVYGLLSAHLNQNPYDCNVTRLAWHWAPSPVWLPSYARCKVPPNGLFISHTRSGYLFRTERSRRAYIAVSAMLGATLGLTVGAGALAVRRRCAGWTERFGEDGHG